MAILPILLLEDNIIQAVEQNPVVVILGETGSGKSTQLSQILHRKGFSKDGLIAVTQPRRVAAVSVARRVTQELGVLLGDEVGYAIRFEDRTSYRTKLKVHANQRAGRAGRTCPGKCYRLYPSTIYSEEFLDATIPKIQQCSLAATALYLKSLDLSDIDIVKFDFLDPPSGALEDALKQLYLIDAIDENGIITSIGRTMAELPLEPSLSRTLLESNEYGCLFQAVTVAAMLSSETTLLLGRSKNANKKRKQTCVLPDGSGLGDHIQLLQIYEQWDEADYDTKWCMDNELQVRGMMFVKNVRKQLVQIMEKISRGSLDVRSDKRLKEKSRDYKNLRKALCIGYGNQLAERMIHHNGYRTLGFKPQLVQVHPSSAMRVDEEGVLPNYIIYHELITTSRPFLRNVCAVDMAWVSPVLNKLQRMDVRRLSGGKDLSSSLQDSEVSEKSDVGDTHMTSHDRDTKIQAARDRFLARRVTR